ncbi:PAB-dependent poly(A)-specific ribonuclease subunit 3 [Basidiobolus ranarum]|uniref:PAB-dependent poly(A)-specific ribonuclease subunit 3 n=1 Tax=Basidiobolus ranarum TaxID=34480 RepID=A0ABR2VTY3_9FUNG
MNSDPPYTKPLIQAPLGSSAIPIVAPTEETQEQKDLKTKAPSSAPTTPNAKTRTCRNVIIHGYCKYDGKGCEFNHDLNPTAPSFIFSPDSKSKLRVSSPAFNPTGSLASATMPNSPAVTGERTSQTKHHISNDVEWKKGAHESNIGHYQHYPPVASYSAVSSSNPNTNALSNDVSSFDSNDQSTENLRSQLQYHLYTTPLPQVSSLPSSRKTIHSFFISDELRERLQKRNEAIHHSNPHDLTTPSEVHVYHSLYPLDDSSHTESKRMFGYPTSVYKATSSIDGQPYVLRRIEDFRLTNEAAMSTIENWRKISHPNIVSVREAFTTRAFGDYSLVLVYDYHPCSSTLAEKYLNHPTSRGQQSSKNIVEMELWSFIIQIASAIRTLHAAGLAACTLDPAKILITGKNRIRLNCCGIYDILSYASTRNTAHYQQEDLLQFGQLLTCLTCSSLNALSSLPISIDFIARHYTPDVKNVILYLISKPSTTKNINDIITMIAPKMLLELNPIHQ